MAFAEGNWLRIEEKMNFYNHKAGRKLQSVSKSLLQEQDNGI